MTIHQLSLFGLDVTSGPPSSLSDLYPPFVSSPPQVNYVATCPMPAFSDIIIVHHVLGALGLDFRNVVLPSDEKLLESMTSYSS